MKHKTGKDCFAESLLHKARRSLEYVTSKSESNFHQHLEANPTKRGNTKKEIRINFSP